MKRLREKPQRVLLVSRPVSPPWDEGSKNAVRLLALNMRAHILHLMTAISAPLCLEAGDNVVVEPVYSQPELTVLTRFQLLLRLIRNSPLVDIYHFYFVPRATTSTVLRVVVGRARVRAVQTIPSLPNRSMSDGTIRRLVFADVVVAMSRWTEQRLRSAGISPVVQIGPPVDVQKYSPDAISPPNRAWLMQELDRKLVLYAGEYTRLGGLSVLSNAILRVCRTAGDINFVVPGRIKSRSDLASKKAFLRFLKKRGLIRRVRVLGTVDDIPSLVRACSLVVFPAKEMIGKFDIPMFLAECLAMGKPLIISNIPPLSEVVEDGAGVVISSADDGSELAEMILRLLGDRVRLRHMGEAGRKLALARYDARIVAQRYADLYAQL
ncbi:glycosyltransferase family 4 protein [Acidobacteria bacterium AH-259-D05]|nr:glycosyltransferase family 4 protein [Acidobacteria bacterium AH-259-D05]